MTPDWLAAAWSPSRRAFLIASQRPRRTGSRRIGRHIDRMHYSMIGDVVVFALDNRRRCVNRILLGLEENRAALFAHRLAAVVEIHLQKRAVAAQRGELPVAGKLELGASGYRDLAKQL